MTGNRDRTPLLLTLAAFAVGVLIVLGAAFLPLVSVESSSASSAAAPATSSAEQSSTLTIAPTTQTLTVSSEETLLTEEGAGVLAVAAVPALVSLAVGGLLLVWSATWRRAYLRIAWTLAGLLLAAALVEFVTFLIGIFVLPVAGLLLVACALASSARPSPVKTES